MAVGARQPLSSSVVSLALMLTVALAAPLLGADRRTRFPVIASTATIASLTPRIEGPVAPSIRVKLTVAYSIAAGRLRTHPECAEMFSKLGGYGLTSLKVTVWRFASTAEEQAACGRGSAVAAFTRVGGARPVMCRAFVDLGLQDAAVVVLHEALHFAGLGQSHSGPILPDSQSINATVRLVCGL